jgi:YgiT-type zinc finger domain-containing protein
MSCPVCGNVMVASITSFTVMRDGAIYVTEEVPCLQCPVCEHIAFTQEVARKLERYSSGRTLPMSTYRTSVFKYKYGAVIIEVPVSVPSNRTNDWIQIPGTVAVPIAVT